MDGSEDGCQHRLTTLETRFAVLDVVTTHEPILRSLTIRGPCPSPASADETYRQGQLDETCAVSFDATSFATSDTLSLAGVSWRDGWMLLMILNIPFDALELD